MVLWIGVWSKSRDLWSSAGLDFLDGVGEVCGQVAAVEDGAFVAAWGLSGDGADE